MVLLKDLLRTGTGGTGGDGFDYQSILDAIAGVQQPQFDMSALTDMFNTQFDQLSSQFDQDGSSAACTTWSCLRC
jgi:hypothetical protein